MITLDIPDRDEQFDVVNQVFVPSIPGGRFTFEHSLRSLTVWEEKHQVPFLHTRHTNAQLVDYVVMMCLSPINPMLVTNDVLRAIIPYLSYTPSATRITPTDGGKGKIITAEVIYAWMAGANIPFECDTWNLKKLLLLLNVVSAQQNPPKKKSYDETIRDYKSLNEKRKAEMNTRG